MSEVSRSVPLETLEGPIAAASAAAKRDRIVIFALASIVPVIFVCLTMKSLAAVTLRNDSYSHLPLIPVISVFLIFSRRRQVLSHLSTAWRIGGAFVTTGLACLALGNLNPWHWGTENEVSMVMLGVVLTWVGSFALCFGSRASRVARFPLLFLLFMIPLPELVLHRTTVFLQQESANATAFMFSIFGTPYLQQGVDFSLPGVVIHVAEECSGIRSTLALLILATLVSYWSLRTFWKKALFCLLVFPVAIFKNGLRIAILSILAVYVNPAFLHGSLHQYGGVVFFMAGLVPLGLVLRWFQRTEA